MVCGSLERSLLLDAPDAPVESLGHLFDERVVALREVFDLRFQRGAGGFPGLDLVDRGRDIDEVFIQPFAHAFQDGFVGGESDPAGSVFKRR